MLKREGLKDHEIAKEMGMCRDTLRKKIYAFEIPPQPKIRNNEQGITEKQLLMAEKRGIDRRNALKRVRVLGWTIKDAISIPVKGRKPNEMSDM